jgi:hypothetical protein
MGILLFGRPGQGTVDGRREQKQLPIPFFDKASPHLSKIVMKNSFAHI